MHTEVMIRIQIKFDLTYRIGEFSFEVTFCCQKSCFSRPEFRNL